MAFKLLQNVLAFLEGKVSLKTFMQSCNWSNRYQFYILFYYVRDTIFIVSTDKIPAQP